MGALIWTLVIGLVIGAVALVITVQQTTAKPVPVDAAYAPVD